MMFYLMIKISPLPKYNPLYLKAHIPQIWNSFDILFFKPLKGLYSKYCAQISIGVLITGDCISFFPAQSARFRFPDPLWYVG